MSRVAVITGGSSGIGKACANTLLAYGWTVYELSRSGTYNGGVRHITADVTNENQVKTAFKAIFADCGRLDLLINNAGMGISGAVEFTDTPDAKGIFEVNFFGVFFCAREALPYLRKTPGAQMINVSSAAAVFAIPYQAFYSATKAAVNSLMVSLGSELKQFGIRVNAVMPGDVKTGFTAAREKNTAGDALYGEAIERAVGVMEEDEMAGMPPEKAARRICTVANKHATGRIYTVGAKYKLFVLLGRLLPQGLIHFIVSSMYR